MYRLQKGSVDMSPFKQHHALKEFIADLHLGGGGVILKQLNCPIAVLPIGFRSVDYYKNTCRSCKFPHFYSVSKLLLKKNFLFYENIILE